MLLDKLKNYNIILGSSSPRRKELLAGLGINFEVSKIDADESYTEDTPTFDISKTIAYNKSLAYDKDLKENDILITADTIVVIGKNVLGKPSDKNEAVKMLKSLSGKKHQVITGVCLRNASSHKLFSSITEVAFRKLTEKEINYYIDNYKPFDKAGSYGVQEWIGFSAITGINGSYYNVMGLPVQVLHTELNKFIG